MARPSTESEYRAISNLTTEIVWIRSLLNELKFPSSATAILWCDNLSAGSLACNPVFHARTKHIELDVHFIRDKIQAKEVEVRYVPLVDQTAYILTKLVSHTRFSSLKDKLEVLLSSLFHLMGNVKA